MENFIENLMGKAGKAIRHWWLLLISGILTIGTVVKFRHYESIGRLSL